MAQLTSDLSPECYALSTVALSGQFFGRINKVLEWLDHSMAPQATQCRHLCEREIPRESPCPTPRVVYFQYRTYLAQSNMAGGHVSALHGVLLNVKLISFNPSIFARQLVPRVLYAL